mmetsp:Transcript_114371/g.180031  ORF Transcript_114371/g.180031 Transcript_114371/m.180031 type:complete len:143 (+) Transcript_114371:77-505(+)
MKATSISVFCVATCQCGMAADYRHASSFLHAAEPSPNPMDGVTALHRKATVIANAVGKMSQKEKLLPIGEGAYQDPKAVMQRTVDKDLHCEEGKWHDCYKDKGDYLDGHSYGNHDHSIFKSSAFSASACVSFLLTISVFLRN